MKVWGLSVSRENGKNQKTRTTGWLNGCNSLEEPKIKIINNKKKIEMNIMEQ